MEASPLGDIRSYFAPLTDPRSSNARHRLLAIVVMAIGAIICGAEGWEDREEYGRVQAPWCAELFD